VKPLSLKVLSPRFSVVRLDPVERIPAWVAAGEFYSITGTHRELSLVCESRLVPDLEGVRCETGWRAFEVQGPLAFGEVGIMARLSRALASRGISLFAVSTYDTDYILVQDGELRNAVLALENDGHHVIR
jgi:hypothetical protein